MYRRLALRTAALAWCLAGVWAIAVGGSLRVKAELAEWLIADSWQRGVTSGRALKPWPWADTRVAAQLRLPSIAARYFVLDNDSGSALAFGPGFSSVFTTHESSSVQMISGHRDTHFAQLDQLASGDALSLEGIDGSSRRYRVWRSTVVDSRQGRLPMGVEAGDLLLVTCYPLDAVVPGGPLRLVLIAKPVMPRQMGVAGRMHL